MRFDTVIIGGGLSGLTCGIRLAEAGQKCAVVSAGQSALHFSSGSFDLLGYIDGKEVSNPLEAIKALPATHPYSLLGAGRVKELANEVTPFMQRMGVNVQGNSEKNHYRLTPIGNLRPTWLTCEEYFTIDSDKKVRWEKVLILQVAGFLDFPTEFIAEGLEKLGMKCSISAFSLPELMRLRKNPSEMRSANIARVFESEEALAHLVEVVKDRAKGYDVVLLPAVIGLYSPATIEYIQKEVGQTIKVVATLPPSVPGIRIQMMMRKYFQSLGGLYMLGDIVEKGNINGTTLESINTEKQGDIKIEADNFVIATGNFFSHGMKATPSGIIEPIFGLDVNCSPNRGDWYDKTFLHSQPYMKYGVATDADFHAMKGGRAITNLYVAGSLLSGADSVKEGCGAGISMLTSMEVAAQIINKTGK